MSAIGTGRKGAKSGRGRGTGALRWKPVGAASDHGADWEDEAFASRGPDEEEPANKKKKQGVKEFAAVKQSHGKGAGQAVQNGCGESSSSSQRPHSKDVTARATAVDSTARDGADTPKESPASPKEVEHLHLLMLQQQLKTVQQQVGLRKSTVERLRHDIAKMQDEAAASHRQELQLRAAGGSYQTQLFEQEEAMRSRLEALKARVEEQEKSAASRCNREREWREELDSMMHQQEAAGELTSELERDIARWRKAAAEQASRLRKAEAKLKSFETKRAEQRAQGEQFQLQVNAFRQDAAQVVAESQELRKRINRLDVEVARRRQQWQVASLVLLLVLLMLLFMG